MQDNDKPLLKDVVDPTNLIACMFFDADPERRQQIRNDLTIEKSGLPYNDQYARDFASVQSVLAATVRKLMVKQSDAQMQDDIAYYEAGRDFWDALYDDNKVINPLFQHPTSDLVSYFTGNSPATVDKRLWHVRTEYMHRLSGWPYGVLTNFVESDHVVHAFDTRLPKDAVVVIGSPTEAELSHPVLKSGAAESQAAYWRVKCLWMIANSAHGELEELVLGGVHG